MKDIINISANVDSLKVENVQAKIKTAEIQDAIDKMANFTTFIQTTVNAAASASNMFSVLKPGISNYPLPPIA
jgi:hypothetical protein